MLIDMTTATKSKHALTSELRGSKREMRRLSDSLSETRQQLADTVESGVANLRERGVTEQRIMSGAGAIAGLGIGLATDGFVSGYWGKSVPISMLLGGIVGWYALNMTDRMREVRQEDGSVETIMLPNAAKDMALTGAAACFAAPLAEGFGGKVEKYGAKLKAKKGNQSVGYGPPQLSPQQQHPQHVGAMPAHYAAPPAYQAAPAYAAPAAPAPAQSLTDQLYAMAS